jgi:hypothetical protein
VPFQCDWQAPGIIRSIIALPAAGRRARPGPPGNLSGIVELEIDQIEVLPDYALDAAASRS